MDISLCLWHRIFGKTGRITCSPFWHRELSAETPAVGSAFLTLNSVVFEYKESERATEDESNVVDELLSRELDRLLRHALGLRKYSSVDGMNVQATMDKSFDVVKEGKRYECRLRRVEYDYGWEVAPSQEAWDAGIEAEKERERRKEAEKEEKRKEANARRRQRAAEKRARDEAADPGSKLPRK